MIFRFKTLPLIICALLNIISDKVEECQSVEGFATVARRFLPSIHYSELMKHMKMIKHYKPNPNDTSRLKTSQHLLSKPEMEEKEELTMDSTIDMLQSPPPNTKKQIAKQLLLMDPSKLAIMNKKLYVALIITGKLQRIRERQRRPSLSKHESFSKPSVEVSTVEIPIIPENDESEEKEEMKTDELTEDAKSSGKKMTALVLEESIVQILRGFREMSNL